MYACIFLHMHLKKKCHQCVLAEADYDHSDVIVLHPCVLLSIFTWFWIKELDEYVQKINRILASSICYRLFSLGESIYLPVSMLCCSHTLFWGKLSNSFHTCPLYGRDNKIINQDNDYHLINCAFGKQEEFNVPQHVENTCLHGLYVFVIIMPHTFFIKYGIK